MVALEQFRWTTRSEVCERLLRFVEEAPAELPAERDDGSFAEPSPERARILFFLLADESFALTLRKMLADETAAQADRLTALRTLVWLDGELPREELEPRLHDRSLREEEWDDGGLDEVLRLFRTEEAQRLAREHLSRLAPEERTRLLLKVEDDHHPCYGPADRVAAELADWLYEQWLCEDRQRLEGMQDEEYPLNLQVAVETRWRAESRPLVIEYWRRAGAAARARVLESLRLVWVFDELNRAHREAEWWQQEYRHALEDEQLRADCAAGDPAVYQSLAEALDLSHDHLIRCWGAEPLLSRIEQRVRSGSQTLRADRSSCAAAHTLEFERTLQILYRWPGREIDSRIASLCACPHVDSSIQHRLREVLWDRLRRDEPAQAMAVAQAEPANSGTYFRVHSILPGTRGTPEPQDREFLIWASGQSDIACRYWALQALEKLGEASDEWRERLLTLSEDPNVYIRLNALAALARRGDESCRAEVVRLVRSAEDVHVRGEAVRLLGELDPERHLDVLSDALLQDHETIRFDYTPAAEEAALALTRLGTPKALTALIQAFLIAPRLLTGALHWYFELMDPPGAPCPDLCLYPIQNWRHARSRYWLGS